MVDSVTHTGQRTGLRLALLAFAQFIVALDYNIVYVALPDIGKELGFSAQSLQWVVSAYVVAFGGFLLFGGRAVDRIGPRRVFMLGLALYGVASLIGGFATEPGLLVGARAVQGLGGALLFPATLALIAIYFQGAAYGRAMGVWGAAGSAGLSAGALLGGVLTNYLGWQWVLFVNVPLVVVAVLAAPKLVPADSTPARASGFDVPGALLATIGLTAVVFGLVRAPELGWLTPQGLGLIGAGVVLLALFAFVESRSANPLAPLRMFTNRALLASMGLIVLFQVSLAGGYYLFTTYLQGVLGYSPLAAGLAFLPLTLISMASSSLLAARLMGKWGLRTALFVGTLVSAVGIGVIGMGMVVGGSFWTLAPGIVIWGIGGGITFPVMFVAAGSGAAPEEQGVASAFASTSQQIGGAVGLAVIVAVANSTVDLTGGAAPTASAVADGLRLAGLVAAVVTVAGALCALALAKPEAAVPATVPAPEAA